MGMFRQRIENVPYWVINLLSIASGAITIATAIFGVVIFISSKNESGQLDINRLFLILIILLVLLGFGLFLRLWKYRKLSKARLRSVSESLHDLTHKFRDVFFDILHHYKTKALNAAFLTESIGNFLKSSLDLLCKIMEDYTGVEVCSCIKLIEYNEEIKVEDAKVTVFCRSSNTDKERVNYDKQPHEIYLKDDSSLMQVVGDNARDHFSCSDLKKYRTQHSNEKEYYKNPNQNWENYYIGTFIVPIRIEFGRLYYAKHSESYHVIGFLCLDSLSKNAFLPNQERYNADVVKAFADLFYVILSKYSHYLKKLAQQNQGGDQAKQAMRTIVSISPSKASDADGQRQSEVEAIDPQANKGEPA